MNPIENIPDFVVYALSTPELRSSEELQQWLAESQANKDLFDDLLAYREAERRLLPENTPDVELQWKRIRQKKRQKRRRCVKMRTFFFYAQSPYFHKLGLCY
ncbi:hypothetical protein, partial [Bacteroides acidifaciens]|uniref:hypothetical protein n=1 Tax=Bacteroides acidifaciens TaxID=85831 RepID=UPI00214BE1E3